MHVFQDTNHCFSPEKNNKNLFKKQKEMQKKKDLIYFSTNTKSEFLVFIKITITYYVVKILNKIIKIIKIFANFKII